MRVVESGIVRGKVYVDGSIGSPEEARVSVFDRGFLYGDSVYETLRVYSGVPFAFEEHVERLFASAARVYFTLPWSRAELEAATRATLAAAELGDAYLRIVATRGSGAVGLDPALARDPQLVIMALELYPPPAEAYERGRTAAVVGTRRNFKGAIDPAAKTGNYLNSVLAAHEARTAKADEAIMLSPEGEVAEGHSASLFALVDGVWLTPPLEVGILDGITRRIVLRLAGEHDIAMAERSVSLAALRGAREVFLASSLREVLPLTRIDGAPVGDGAVGAATRRVHALYRDEVRRRTVSW